METGKKVGLLWAVVFRVSAFDDTISERFVIAGDPELD